MSYDKDKVKEKIEDEDVFLLLEYLGAEPQNNDNHILCKTICHNGDSHKLYYYYDQKLFKCYTYCQDAFDIFELVMKVKDIDLNKAIYFIVNFFNLYWQLDEYDDEEFSLEDWKIFSQWDKTNNISINNELIVLPEYDKDILKHYPKPRYANWEKDGISKEICDYMGICYNPVDGSIVIPHYDENDRLVGIRERTLVQEEEKWGKYRPMRKIKKNNKFEYYNHPLAFNLYGLNKAKENIKNMQVAIVCEGEKSVLQYLSYFGTANDICVSVCGSSLSKYQFNLLLNLGVKEIVIGFDKDFQDIGDEDYLTTISKLQKIYDKYSSFVNISFLFDKEGNRLGYKNSPLDCGRETFLHLFRNRIVI